ncbi:MAG: preprotein translocase subunit SecY, partial [Hyphomicrobiales bacterium]|nr:preprotein translocase subunit SecY [Hyphomicrobiales bacterium]
MIEAVVSAFKIPDLRRKMLFTLGMLVLFRMIASVPVPGVNRDELADFIESNQLLGMLNLFSGNGLSNFSILALGVYPYITASIIMQLMTPIIPRLNELSNEGQQGRNKINQYTHWLTVPLALLQGYGQALLFSRTTGADGQPLIQNFGLFDGDTFLPTAALLISMTAGTVLLVCMGELITEN